MEIVVGINAIEHKGVAIHRGGIATIIDWSATLYLVAHHIIPTLQREIVAHKIVTQRAIAIVLIHRYGIGKRTCAVPAIVSLERVSKVGHKHSYGICLGVAIRPLNIVHKHIIPVVGVVKVARSHIYTLCHCGKRLGYSCGRLWPAVVVHNNSHRCLRTPRKATIIAVHRTIAVVGLALTPTRSIKHYTLLSHSRIGPLSHCRAIGVDIV